MSGNSVKCSLLLPHSADKNIEAQRAEIIHSKELSWKMEETGCTRELCDFPCSSFSMGGHTDCQGQWHLCLSLNGTKQDKYHISYLYNTLLLLGGIPSVTKSKIVLLSHLSSPVLSISMAIALFRTLIRYYLPCSGLSQCHPPAHANVRSFTNSFLIALVPQLKAL